MEIIGSHDNGIVEDNLECLLKIKNGILGVYTHGNTDSQKLNKPQNEKKWNFRKVNWKESKPVKIKKISKEGMEWVWKYSHVIEYLTGKNETQRIFINPNRRQRFLIKYINSQLLYQKITAPEYILGLIFAFMLNLAAAWFYNLISDSDTSPAINNNTITINHATTKPANILNSNQQKNIDSTTMSSTQDLKRHQGDSLIHDIKH